MLRRNSLHEELNVKFSSLPVGITHESKGKFTLVNLSYSCSIAWEIKETTVSLFSVNATATSPWK